MLPVSFVISTRLLNLFALYLESNFENQININIKKFNSKYETCELISHKKFILSG